MGDNNSMHLSLGKLGFETCPECGGRGRVACPPTLGNPSGPNADKFQPSTGYPIPCPKCKGKKIVPVTLERE